MTGPIVPLDRDELVVAAAVGARRQGRVGELGLHNPLGDIGSGVWRDTVGAAGELAVAKHFGVYWNPHGDDWRRCKGDVGRLQVRSGRTFHLRIHDDDPDAPFVAVRFVDDTLTQAELAGWLFAEEARAMPWHWREAGLDGKRAKGGFFVPNGELRHVDTIPTHYRKEMAA